MTRFLIVIALIAASAVVSAQRTVWHGVYTAGQAARGEQSYATHCASCHRDDLSGYDSLLRGPRFMTKYREANLILLFDKTKSTMPRNAAGSLSDQTYLDIVSYVLKMNDFPAGSNELGIDDVANVRLVGKGGAEPVPNFSLVQVVGCLGRSGEEWTVTHGTDPVRTGSPRPAPEELSVLDSQSPGTNTYGLMVTAAYAPATHDGKTVEVRGFLMRRPTDTRINVTSIEAVGPACGP